MSYNYKFCKCKRKLPNLQRERKLVVFANEVLSYANECEITLSYCIVIARYLELKTCSRTKALYNGLSIIQNGSLKIKQKRKQNNRKNK